ncbi:MAG TPA: DNA-processing protein DprA [Candidatus Moranbacteria bacterium]|nr:DNA-processing protein DprA [Candidatus Moranbacteria bacterium]HRZ33422.1 DNA-processing protein DprA [Candidatus Moranbacteria bacterium]
MKYLNALNKIDGLGCKKLKQLMNFFNSSEIVWEADFSSLVKSGIGELVAEKIVTQRPNINPNEEWDKLKKENVKVFTIQDEEYPELLKQIPDSPYLIYMKGNLNCLKLPMVAVVGSRKLTEYGSRVTRVFARDLANNGICVVSGLAFGIDSAAHQGALDAKGKTIAVLGNSLDAESIYPRSNFQLAQDIIENDGLLISEFAMKTQAANWTFPARNRIMAGMSLGTLVIEAALESGSLITANLALDYNREVFAVPGSVFSPQSAGTHMLIKSSGAKLVSCATDILSELRIEQDIKPATEKINLELTEEEKNILSVLSHEKIYIDRITKLTKLETATVSSTLSLLEIKGLVKNIGGQQYIKL